MSRKITALRLQKRNPHRVNVFLDGEFAFGLSRIVAAWLRVGQELTEEKIAALQAEDAVEVAYQRAVRFLSYRPRTREEVRRNLEKHEMPPSVVETVLERLQENGLLDDAAFARAWVENRLAFRPRGARILRQELRQRGVPEKITDAVLEASLLDETDLAYRAGQKRLRRLRHLPWQEFRQKMGAYLARRGFSYDVASEAVRRLWDDLQSNLKNDETEETP